MGSRTSRVARPGPHRVPSVAVDAFPASGYASANKRSTIWNSTPGSAKFAGMRPATNQPIPPGVPNQVTLRISAAVRSTMTADGCIVLDTRRGQILGLNKTGAAVFNLLQREFDPSRIAREICRECETDIQTAQSDILEFIEALEGLYIVENTAREALR